MYVCLAVYTCVYACVYVYICGICMCTGVCSCEFMGWVMCCSDPDPFGELDPSQEIQSCARYGPDTLAIRKLTYEMIWRSVPVRAVKTRR